MPSDNLVLIDTSVWIDYLSKKENKLDGTVDQLLENSRIACASLILAELVQGAKTEKETGQIKEFFSPLYWIESNDSHWDKAGEISFRLKKRGKTVSLTDCFIAALAKSDEAKILTHDKDFQSIAEINECELFIPK